MRGIDKRFPGVLALENVDLTLEPGKVHALMGENGAGKSTLIKIMAGVYEKDAGTIRIQGREVEIKSPRDSLKQGIKVVFQEIALISEFTVAENIFLEGYPTGAGGSIDWRKIKADSAALFKRIGFNVDPAARTGSLPVSQQQMVEIARALAHEARVVVMDEPTSSLTPNEVALLFTVIRRLTSLGIAVLYVSHKLDEVLEIADMVTVLRDGRHISTKADRRAHKRHPDSGHDRAAHRQSVPASARRSRDKSGAFRSGLYLRPGSSRMSASRRAPARCWASSA